LRALLATGRSLTEARRHGDQGKLVVLRAEGEREREREKERKKEREKRERP